MDWSPFGMSAAIVLLALVFGSCARPVPAPRPAPEPPATVWATFDVIACAMVPAAGSPCTEPIAGALVKIKIAEPDHFLSHETNGDGYTLFTVPNLPWSELFIDAAGYVSYSVGIHTPDLEGRHNVFTLARVKPAHVDPSVFALEDLAAIRGAMWPTGSASTCGPVPLGPRPGDPTNVIATDFMSGYSPEVQACILSELRARGYTHVVVGPIVDSDGYHGIWTPRDWRGAAFEEFLDVLQLFWDHGLAPIVFVHPDGWTFEQTAELTPLFQSERAQRLVRLVVPGGWEPTQYGWSSVTWAKYGQWARETLPNALVLLHTVTDVDAPVGEDDLYKDTGHPNADGWARVAPFFHGWLSQSAAFIDPDGHGDPNHPEKTNFENWQDQFRPEKRGSYRDRFENGYAGWPKFSAWGPDKPILVYAGEYSAYWRFWRGRSEAEGNAWGDAAMRAGARGYLDGGTVTVPSLRR